MRPKARGYIRPIEICGRKTSSASIARGDARDPAPIRWTALLIGQAIVRNQRRTRIDQHFSHADGGLYQRPGLVLLNDVGSGVIAEYYGIIGTDPRHRVARVVNARRII